MKLWYGCLLSFFVLLCSGTCFAQKNEPEVNSKPLAAAPKLDAAVNDWGNVPATKVKVTPANANDDKNYTGSIDVEVRSGTHGGKIYFLVQWPDSTKDATHKTLHWNVEKDGYVEGKDREDRLAFNFEMSGDFHFCMLGGTEYKADIWHWKAFRSQGAGVAHDKMHIISYSKIPKAKEHKGRNGKTLWIARPGDKGDKLYKSQRPIDNIGDSVPRYIVNPGATGSVADVKSAAKWADGKWTVEFSRKLDTGNSDDIKFEKGKSYSAGMAVFNHTGDDHHSNAAWVLNIKK